MCEAVGQPVEDEEPLTPSRQAGTLALQGIQLEGETRDVLPPPELPCLRGLARVVRCMTARRGPYELVNLLAGGLYATARRDEPFLAVVMVLFSLCVGLIPYCCWRSPYLWP